MKLFLVISLLFLSSCQWLNERAIKGWTSDTIETLREMSHRKSMIHDTPLKTMEALESPDGVTLSQKDLCNCASNTYGGIMTVIANDVKDSSVKSMCKGMARCFFKGKATEFFTNYCIEHISKSGFQKLARDRRESLMRFTKARRQLSSHCRKL